MTAAHSRWLTLTFYQRFEHVIILVLTALIAVVIVFAVWNLAMKVLFSLVLSGTFDPTDPVAFQTVFGMIFTVIIALRIQAIARGAHRARGNGRTGAHGDSHRHARGRPEVDHPGS